MTGSDGEGPRPKEKPDGSGLRSLGREVIEERPTFRIDGDRFVMERVGVEAVEAGARPAPVPPAAVPTAPAPPAPPRAPEAPAEPAQPAAQAPSAAPREARPARAAAEGPQFEPPPPPPPPQPLPTLTTRPGAEGRPIDPTRPLVPQFAAREGSRPGGTRPGTNPGSAPGHCTSPGRGAQPGAISADVRANPPVAVAIVRRGAQLPDATFTHELLEAECPIVLDLKIPTIGLVQRVWWTTEEAVHAGAKALAEGLAGEHGSVPAHATWHIAYGPGHAKVLLILLRKQRA